MDIGTAKPSRATRETFSYLMLDRADPWEAYSAARFVQEARPQLQSGIILVAGTILYLRALIEGLFEGPSADEAIRAELAERARVERLDHAAWRSWRASIRRPAGKIHPQRCPPADHSRLEVYRLTGTPISTLQTQWSQARPRESMRFILAFSGKRRRSIAGSTPACGKWSSRGWSKKCGDWRAIREAFRRRRARPVGYKQLLDHFAGKGTLDEAIEEIKIQTRYLAKMQRTWLKRQPPPRQSDLASRERIHTARATRRTGDERYSKPRVRRLRGEPQLIRFPFFATGWEYEPIRLVPRHRWLVDRGAASGVQLIARVSVCFRSGLHPSRQITTARLSMGPSFPAFGPLTFHDADLQG